MSFLPVKVHKTVPPKKVEKRFGRKGRTQNCDEVVSGAGGKVGRGMSRLWLCNRSADVSISDQIGFPSGTQGDKHTYTGYTRNSGISKTTFVLSEKVPCLLPYFRVSSRFLPSFSLKQSGVKAMQASLQSEGRESYSEISVSKWSQWDSAEGSIPHPNQLSFQPVNWGILLRVTGTFRRV